MQTGDREETLGGPPRVEGALLVLWEQWWGEDLPEKDPGTSGKTLMAFLSKSENGSERKANRK